MTTYSCSEDEFLQHQDMYDGLCLACGEWTCGGVEPDARNYECPSCHARKVCGAEEALMMGSLTFGEDL